MKKLLGILGSVIITSSSASYMTIESFTTNKKTNYIFKNSSDKNIDEFFKNLGLKRQKDLINFIISLNEKSVNDNFEFKITGYCPKNVLIKIKEASKDYNYVNFLKTENLNNNLEHPKWGHESHWNNGGYKYITRWNWWTYISGFWNIDVSEQLCNAIKDGSLTAGELTIILSEALAELPILVTTVAGVVLAILGLSLVWQIADKGNGVYQDFELIVPGKLVSSDIDWDKI